MECVCVTSWWFRFTSTAAGSRTAAAANVTRLKEGMEDGGGILWELQTGIDETPKKRKKKETDSINIWKHTYGTNMQQVWQRVALFLNQITMETVQKGRGVGGHGRSVER